MKVTHIGHASFLVELKDKKFLFDPWVKGNEKAAFDIEEVKKMDADFVFVSHGHGDHGFAEAVEITRDTRATAIGVFELINALTEKGGTGIGANIGGRFVEDGVEIYLANAAHSCPFANPCGFVVSYKGETVYHAGDTALIKDMELLPELFDMDVALLPAGGHFTMGPDELKIARGMLKAKNYVAMHYGTFPAIEQDLKRIRELADVIGPGQSREY
ncbi:metal-dependent hydrolase [Candidatus Micrarchaeota archaeon]|nr:metal-dependent hydrolase [Candidatus Micrarchaeota archaeon]